MRSLCLFIYIHSTFGPLEAWLNECSFRLFCWRGVNDEQNVLGISLNFQQSLEHVAVPHGMHIPKIIAFIAQGYVGYTVIISSVDHSNEPGTLYLHLKLYHHFI